MNNKRFTVFLLIFSVLTALYIPISAIIPTSDDMDLYDNIIRLHVIANSDSDCDQELKLKVRDSLLTAVANTVGDCHDIESAKSVLAESLDTLKTVAQDTVYENGYNYSVNVTLTTEYYPTREYRGVKLPCGEYTSLRVLIGDADGKNWWCVLFPQLCVVTATGKAADFCVIDDTEPLIEAGLTRGQIELITGDSPTVTVKFRILEWIKSLSKSNK